MTKTKHGVKTVSLSDFLQFSLETCPKYLTLSKILTGVEIMLNIMIFITENNKITEIQVRDSSNIRELIQKKPYMHDSNWTILLQLLPSVRNFLRHLPCSIITDDITYYDKLNDFKQIMKCIRKLYHESTIAKEIQNHPQLKKKLSQTDVLISTLIKSTTKLPKTSPSAAKSLIPSRKRGWTKIFQIKSNIQFTLVSFLCNITIYKMHIYINGGELSEVRVLHRGYRRLEPDHLRRKYSE